VATLSLLMAWFVCTVCSGRLLGNLTDGTTPIVSKIGRWFFFADTAALARELRRMSQARHNITHILVAHGEVISTDDCSAVFERMAADLS